MLAIIFIVQRISIGNNIEQQTIGKYGNFQSSLCFLNDFDNKIKVHLLPDSSIDNSWLIPKLPSPGSKPSQKEEPLAFQSRQLLTIPFPLSKSDSLSLLFRKKLILSNTSTSTSSSLFM